MRRTTAVAVLGLVAMLGSGCGEDTRSGQLDPTAPQREAVPGPDDLATLGPQLEYSPVTTLYVLRGPMGYVRATGMARYFGNEVGSQTSVTLARGWQPPMTNNGAPSGIKSPWPSHGTIRTDAMISGVDISCGLTARGTTYGFAKLNGTVSGVYPAVQYGTLASVTGSAEATADTGACSPTPCQNEFLKVATPGSGMTPLASAKPVMLTDSLSIARLRNPTEIRLAESRTIGARGGPSRVVNPCDDDSSGDPDGNGNNNVGTVCYSAFLVWTDEDGTYHEEYLGEWCFTNQS